MLIANNAYNPKLKGFIKNFHFPTPTLNQLWGAFPLFFAVIRGFLAPIILMDFYWHLRLGQVIVETLSIPRTDIFSYTVAGKEFVAQSWLADVLFYLIYKVGGFALIVFSNGILLFLILLPLFFLCRKATPHIWSLVLALFLVAFCIPWNLRPQVFSSALFSFFYWMLWPSRTRSSFAIYALPLLMILWVNLHGAFVIGLVLIAVFIVGELAELLTGRERDEANIRRLKTLGLIFLLCFVATLANPEIIGVYDYVWTILKATSVQKYVSEWQPPVINSTDGFVMFYLPFFLLTFILVCLRKRPEIIELLLYLGFGAYGMVSLRNCVWFLIISAPMIAKYLPMIDWSNANLGAVDSPSVYANESQRRKELPFLNRTIVIAMILVLILNSPWMRMKLHATALQSPDTPVGAMDYIDRNNLIGNIFHPQIYGDYLIWRCWPKQKSFYDGRVHLFDEPFVRSYSRIFQDSDWEKLLHKYDIRYLLLPKEKNKQDVVRIIEEARSSGRWISRYEDKLSILLEKKSRP